MNKGNIQLRILVLGLFALFLTVDGFAKSAEDWYREGVELSSYSRLYLLTLLWWVKAFSFCCLANQA